MSSFLNITENPVIYLMGFFVFYSLSLCMPRKKAIYRPLRRFYVMFNRILEDSEYVTYFLYGAYDGQCKKDIEAVLVYEGIFFKSIFDEREYTSYLNRTTDEVRWIQGDYSEDDEDEDEDDFY